MHQSLCRRLDGQDQVLGLKALLSAVDDGSGEGVEASQIPENHQAIINQDDGSSPTPK